MCERENQDKKGTYENVLLNDTAPLPEYHPHDFKMWRYATDISPAGIGNDGSYIISFVDYSMK